MAHVQKFTRCQIGQLCQHYERKKINGKYVKFGNENIDLSKTHLNYNLAPDRNQIEFIQTRCKELKCLKRKDVNVMCSWAVTMPKTLSANHEKEFFKNAYKFLENRYGKDNVVSAYVHKDEISPHMHFIFIPVVYDKKKNKYKVSAKERINKYELKTFHTDLENYLEKSMGIKIGILNDATRNGNKSILELKKNSYIKAAARVEELTNDLDKRINNLTCVDPEPEGKTILGKKYYTDKQFKEVYDKYKMYQEQLNDLSDSYRRLKKDFKTSDIAKKNAWNENTKLSDKLDILKTELDQALKERDVNAVALEIACNNDEKSKEQFIEHANKKLSERLLAQNRHKYHKNDLEK